MIREAEAGDAGELEKLYKILVPANSNIRVAAERIEQIRNEPNNVLLVYETEGSIAGTVFVTFCMDPMFEFRPYALVENIIVLERWRGRGIGAKLLDYVDELCAAKSCTKCMLLSNNNRVEAHRFFEQKGYNGTLSKGFKKYFKIN
jgi:GNAT superfamily N-acetyltransferase